MRAARPGSGAVFLLSDYGSADEFAGLLRAVVARMAPGAPVVDLTHGIAPFDVRGGALALVRAAPHLGPGVVLGVVDPGVGTHRRAVALGLAGGDRPRALVGPDNGLLPWAAEVLGGVLEAVVLDRVLPLEEEVGHTFDGRDLFAPAAAALWRGAAVTELGPGFDPAELVRLADPARRVGSGTLEAEVLWIDRFGNVELAATAADGLAAGIEPGVRAVVSTSAGASHEVRRVSAFAELGASTRPGAAPELGVVVDANGHLAVVCNGRSAATVLGVGAGDVVSLHGATPREARRS